MVNEFINNLYIPNNNWNVQDPYFYIRIESQDNNDIIQEQINTWTASDITYNPSSSWIGLALNSTNSTITFTQTYDLPKSGKYLLEIKTWKRTQASGNMVVSVDGTTILTEDMHNDWDDNGSWIRCPIIDITDDGSCTISITIPKFSYVQSIRIVPITRYEGGSEYNGPSETRLDIKSINFTANGLTEVDSGEIVIAMKEDYFSDDNPYSKLCFDVWDHVTISIGESMSTSIPLFGGYISGYTLNESLTELTINVIDRLYDFSRNYVWKNFSIGYIPEESGSRFPYTQFPNVNEIARYLCTTTFPVNFEAITKDYVLYNNFANNTDVTSLTNSGWIIDWQPEFGNPAPCMRMRPGIITQNSLTIYDSTLGEWNAAEYNYFNFDYYVSGAGILFPSKFNVEIDMYRAEETYNDAETYIINFSGSQASSSNVIGSVLPLYDGNWNSFLVDLKSLFDKSSGSSSAYYIKAIRFVGTVDENILLDNRCSSIYIDHIMGYRSFQSAPRYASSDSKTALTELQDLCDKCNQVAYIRPGMERRDDQLIMLPKRFYTLPITIEEGENLLSVSSIEYKPIDWEMSNRADNTFNYDDSRVGYASKQNNESIRYYNEIISHEFLSDVKTLEDANTNSQYKVDEHAFSYPAFSVVVSGTTLFEPGQYVYVDIPSRRISGPQEVKDISYILDVVNGTFKTQLTFNSPHRTYMNYIRDSLKSQQQLKTLGNNVTYLMFGNKEAGLRTSSGAYI